MKLRVSFDLKDLGVGARLISVTNHAGRCCDRLHHSFPTSLMRLLDWIFLGGHGAAGVTEVKW